MHYNDAELRSKLEAREFFTNSDHRERSRCWAGSREPSAGWHTGPQEGVWLNVRNVREEGRALTAHICIGVGWAQAAWSSGWKELQALSVSSSPSLSSRKAPSLPLSVSQLTGPAPPYS